MTSKANGLMFSEEESKYWLNLFLNMGTIMPSKTKKQAKLMAACAHGARYTSCPPKSVAKEFNKADVETGIMRDKRKITGKGYHKGKM